MPDALPARMHAGKVTGDTGRLPGLLAASRATVGAVALLCSAWSPSACAADPDVAGLQRDVAALTSTVQRLQARLDQLERRLDAARPAASGEPQAVPPPAPQSPSRTASGVASRPASPRPSAGTAPGDVDLQGSTPLERLRRGWSKIKAGMTTAEVSSLLGDPVRRMSVDGRTVWYYAYPLLGNGSVFFTAAGQVTSYQSPFPWGG